MDAMLILFQCQEISQPSANLDGTRRVQQPLVKFTTKIKYTRIYIFLAV